MLTKAPKTHCPLTWPQQHTEHCLGLCTKLESRAHADIGLAGKYSRLNFTSQTRKSQNQDEEIICELFPASIKKA